MYNNELRDQIIDEDLGRDAVERFIQQDHRTRPQLYIDCHESEGREIFKDLSSLYSSLYIVNNNYSQYIEVRNDLVEEMAGSWLAKPHSARNEHLREYVRVLHNYAASVYTLRSHYYTFRDRYDDKAPELGNKYSHELSARNIDVICRFLSELRHYTQKRWIPPLVSVVEYEGVNRIHIEKSTLLEWDEWSSSSRNYILGLNDEIEITDIGEEYQEKINSLQEWFRSVVVDTFYDEFMACITAELQMKRRDRTERSWS